MIGDGMKMFRKYQLVNINAINTEFLLTFYKGNSQMRVFWSHCRALTNVVGSNPSHGQVYSIRHYVIKFVSDLQQFSDILQDLLFSPPIKLTITEILLEVVLNNKILTVTMRNVNISEQFVIYIDNVKFCPPGTIFCTNLNLCITMQ